MSARLRLVKNQPCESGEPTSGGPPPSLRVVPARPGTFWAYEDLNTGEWVSSWTEPPWSMIQFVFVGKQLRAVPL